LGIHPAGNGWLRGGRNSLLESAQEATLSSVATSAFPRQSNSLAVPHCNEDCNLTFMFVEPKLIAFCPPTWGQTAAASPEKDAYVRQ
jgi:hypothetical protein